jgi:hypothetical protein
MERASPQVQASILLGEHDVSVGAQLFEHSGRSATLILDRPVELDSAMRIEAGDRVWLGEVYRCEETADGWKVEVALNQAVSSVNDLRCLVRAVLGEEQERTTHSRYDK